MIYGSAFLILGYVV